MKPLLKLIMSAALIIAAVACDSNELEQEPASPLASPVLKLLENDTIGWDHVTGAVCYIPNINGEDKEKMADNVMDLSVLGPGEYSVKVKAVGDGKKHSDSPWSQVLTHKVEEQVIEPEPEPEPDQPVAGVLATPVLSVVEPSFAYPSQAYVSWAPVENADSYIVKVDGAEISYEECRADLVDFKGDHMVSVQAVCLQKPDEFSASEVASAMFSVKNYGTGTEADPYLIYTVADWNQMADVINNAEGTYMDKYVALAQDLDCTGEVVKTVGNNSTKNLAGTFDGKGRTISNAVVGSENASAAGLFAYVRGTVRNLAVENCTVVAAGEELARSAVIAAGQVTGQIENCVVRNSSVSLTNTSYGSYGGIIASQMMGERALISECQVQKCTLEVAKEHAGAICGMIDGAGSKVVGCSVSATVVSARNNTGGLVGSLGSSVISGCVVSGGKISSSSDNTGGVVGYCNSDDALIDSCISRDNDVTSGKGKSYSGGIVGNLNAGCAINNVSDGNNVTAGKSIAGGVAGGVLNGHIINNISKDCLVSTEDSGVADQYVGLVLGGETTDATGICKNNVVVSGNVKYGSKAKKYVGIITGIRTKVSYDINYYNASIITEGDLTNTSNDIGPLGKAGLDAGSLTLGGSKPIGEGYEPALADLHTTLNTNVETLSSTYPAIRKWQAVSGGWPTFVE